MELKTLNIDIQQGDITLLSSAAAIGKSTILAVLVSEISQSVKNILILSEEPEKHWIRKLINLDIDDVSNIRVKMVISETQEIKKIIEEHNVNVLICDTPFHSTVYRDTVDFIQYLREKNITSFISHQAKAFPTNNLLDGIQINKLMLVDYALSIDKNPRFTFWEDFKYICLWFLFKKPNRRVKVLKNRRGPDSTKNIFIDFKKINQNPY